MSESKDRPVGVLVLGVLHIAGGAIALVAFVAGFVLRVPQDSQRSGIPLELLLGIAALALLGPGVGRALLKGRPWAWYLASFAYVLTALAGGLTLLPRFEALIGSTLSSNVLRVVAVTLTVVGALAVLYLFTGAVADFFGLTRRTRWIPLLAEIGLAAALLFGLSTALAPGDAEASAEALARLHAMGDRRANSEEEIQFMLERLADGAMEERASAAWALGRAGRGDVLSQLLAATRNDRDVSVRINAIGAAAELGGVEIVDDLLELLNDSESEVQSAALRGLADERFAGAVEAIGQFLLDNEPLRASAVDVLGSMRSADGLPFLRQAVTDSREDVRARAAFALGKIGDRRAVPTLVEMLQDQRWSVRANAAQSLGTIGDRAARPHLAAMRDDLNSQVRAAVAAALEKLR